MTVVETRVSVWEALAGRAPGTPVAPADPGLWAAVAERLNPARAKPVLRPGVEAARLVSVRNVEYVMLRSPDRTLACYLRLTPDELALARLMDGTRTVARLVAEFARITGRLAPDQVTRVVADLAANRMLEELPVDAFRPLAKVKRWPARLGRGLLAGIRGQRLVIARIDPFVTALYKAGGRLLFTRVAAVLLGLVALAGLAVFVWTWALGSQPVFLTGRSYALGAAVLLGLNVLALACHELGHALATKHAGRRVPAAGFLVYFGIPSVFVDTTDVWMAGRRARLLTTAAGPATGLVLAGTAQLASLAYPPLAPWTFKLSFAWYLNVAFNLNPFLALDGYYLLMDWLEVPNLRARAMAWLAARARRRPQRFGDLDREGRLVALYGMLSLIWLVIAANIAYRIYVDRVGGLVTGLWRAGWPQRLLLLAVVAGLAAPLVYVAAGWLGKRWRRLRERLAERSVAADAPRRFDALRASKLGGLPAAALDALARDARWVRPKTGEQLVFAGAAQHSVYVVVDGALEGRRPGDPGGWVRERVGAGGVVGLAPALTGAPSALAWHTAGTTLLSIPPSSVAAAVGPVPGPPPAQRAELEALFDHAPALAQLSTEDKLGLMAAARPVALPPGALLNLSGAQDAAVIASGVLVRADGMELRAGALIGPFGVPPAGPVGAARTPVRAWVLPAFGGLPVLLRTSTPPAPGTGPAFGVHPPAGYPPLAAPPGVPPSTVDGTKDGKFERKLWWLLILLLLFALLLTGSNLLPGPAWGEMPDDRALLHVDKGAATVTVNGIERVLAAGDDYYAGRTDTVSVGDRSLARLTFRGGGYTVLCGGSRVTLGELSSVGRPIEPSGALDLLDGKLLADTAGTSRAFSALNLRVASGGGQLATAGAARFAVAGRDVTVAAGTVSMDGSAVAPVGGALACGNGQIGVIPVPSNSPSPAGPTDSASPSVSASPSASASTTPAATPTATPTKSPTKGPTTGPPSTSASPPPPKDTTKPVIVGAHLLETLIAQQPPQGYNCTGQQQQFEQIAEGVYANDFTDPDDPIANLKFGFTWKLDTDGTSGGGGFRLGDGIWAGGFIVPYAASHSKGGTVTVDVFAIDPAGNRTDVILRTKLDVCIPRAT